jgi:hypothetical protein
LRALSGSRYLRAFLREAPILICRSHGDAPNTNSRDPSLR